MIQSKYIFLLESKISFNYSRRETSCKKPQSSKEDLLRNSSVKRKQNPKESTYPYPVKSTQKK
jgi:uncharacterized protein with ParB-like and HNH nuclease domain